MPARDCSPPFHETAAKYSARYSIGPRGDHGKIPEDERKKRKSAAAKVVVEYYNFMDNIIEKGWSTHYHYAPYAPNETTAQAIAFLEYRLAFLTGLKPGMKVLDVGCGIGGPAREIAKLIGCEIVGVSFNQLHIDRAIEYTAKEGLSHLCTFVKANFLDLPFASESFDAAFSIEACVHAPEYADVYSQVNRVLKPGASFGIVEWVLTPNFDATNTQHINIRNRIERGNGITNLETVSTARAAAKSSGFAILHEEDYMEHWFNTLRFPSTPSPILVPFLDGSKPASPPSKPISTTLSHPSQSPRVWYWALQGRSKLAATCTDRWIARKMKPVTRKVAYGITFVFEKVLRVYTKGACDSLDHMAVCVDSVVEGAVEGIFTPSWWFICRKVGEPVEAVVKKSV